jgi:murein DD-endopeptidase MepM/ murein hydrolase activator NlpD
MCSTPPVGAPPTTRSTDGVTPIPAILQPPDPAASPRITKALERVHGATGSLLGALEGAKTAGGGRAGGCGCTQGVEGAAGVARPKHDDHARAKADRDAPPPAKADAPGGAAPAGFKLTHPLPGAKLTSHYGEVASIRGGRPHSGTDLAKPSGTPILAAAPGKVAAVGFEAGGLGNYVVIDHGNGWTTKYGHMVARSPLKVGDPIDAGAQVGKVGSTGNSTGPHLHFMVVKDGTNQNPEPFLSGARTL